MKQADRDAYVERYTAALAQHGYSPKALGWGGQAREDVRFAAVAEPILTMPDSSVLDVGCGFADLHDFLRARGWQGAYRGVDLVPALLEIARERHPGIDVLEHDIADAPPEPWDLFDFVVASGVFNARLEGEDNLEHISRSVTRMFELSRVAVCVDFQSTYVDYQQPAAWHTDPAWAMDLARGLSKRFRLRHDYMPFEFALTIYRDDAHPGNVFAALGA